MARPPRPERKQELLEQILDYLLDSTLADLTFRRLAEGLGISSYVLVYHFGNRDQLVGEIIRGIAQRFQSIEADGIPRTGRADLVAWARRAFELSLDHRGRHLQRLEFEASVQDVVAENPRRAGVDAYEHWRAFLAGWLVSQGVPAAQAASIARTYVGAIMGLLYDFVITGERRAVLESFDLIAEAFVQQLSAPARSAAS